MLISSAGLHVFSSLPRRPGSISSEGSLASNKQGRGRCHYLPVSDPTLDSQDTLLLKPDVNLSPPSLSTLKDLGFHSLFLFEINYIWLHLENFNSIFGVFLFPRVFTNCLVKKIHQQMQFSPNFISPVQINESPLYVFLFPKETS